jgi:hypothetical protein
MRKLDSDDGSHLLELIRMLEQIVTSFEDANCRPKREIDLYKKYLELRQTQNVKLSGRFIVINGGRAQKKMTCEPHEKRINSALQKPRSLKASTSE